MPRTMPSGLMDMLARKGARVETHTTLQILINNGDIIRNFYFASARLTIDGTVYEPQLQPRSICRMSILISGGNSSPSARLFISPIRKLDGIGQTSIARRHFTKYFSPAF